MNIRTLLLKVYDNLGRGYKNPCEGIICSDCPASDGTEFGMTPLCEAIQYLNQDVEEEV